MLLGDHDTYFTDEETMTPREDPVMRGRAGTGTHVHLTSPQKAAPVGPLREQREAMGGLSDSRQFSAREIESAEHPGPGFSASRGENSKRKEGREELPPHSLLLPGGTAGLLEQG